jgi:hypothetical protein
MGRRDHRETETTSRLECVSEERSTRGGGTNDNVEELFRRTCSPDAARFPLVGKAMVEPGTSAGKPADTSQSRVST